MSDDEQSQDMTPEERKAERQLQRFIDAGEKWVKDGDDGKWMIGRAANLVATKWERKGITLIAYAKMIRMPRPKAIYEIAGTESMFPKSARAHFAESHVISWSHYRAAWRRANKLDLGFEDAMDWLLDAHNNEMDVEEFEEHLRGGPGGDWITKRERIAADLVSAVHKDGFPKGDLTLTVPVKAVQDIYEAKTQRNFRMVVSLVYDIEKVKE